MVNKGIDTMSEAKGQVCGLAPIGVGQIQVQISGFSPLIVHKWSEKSKAEMLANQQMTKEEKALAKANRRRKDPKEDFLGAQYIVNGKHCFPTIAIKKAMIEAGFMLGIPRGVVRQAIYILGDYFEIKHKHCTMREDAVRVGTFRNRVPDLRYRPQYEPWSATLDFQFRTDMIKPDQLVNLLQNAGFSVGIGEWRPQKDGQFGRFEVVTHEEAAP